MKLPFVSALVFAAAILSAQLYPGHLGMVQSATFRLGDPGTRFELKLDPGQLSKIDGVLKSHAQEQLRLSQQMANANDAQGIQKQMEKLDASTASKLLDLLSASQKTRLRQIALQENGAYALRNAGIAKEVGLTPEQRTKIEGISTATIKAMDDLSATMAEEAVKVPDKKKAAVFKRYQPKLDALEKKGKDSILALLTAPQKTKWQSLLGKPFPTPKK